MNLCGYGCDKEALYPPKKGQTKWCCQPYFTKCPGFIKNANRNKVGRTYDQLYGQKEADKRKAVLSQNMKTNNPMLYNIPWNKNKKYVYSEETLKKMRKKGGTHIKGKTYEQLYGKQKSNILKKKRSYSAKKTMTGRIPWNKGVLNCFSVETRKNMSLKAKERMSDEVNRYLISKKLKQSLNYYKENYPFFYKIETPIEDSEGNILVRCKMCNELFTPSGNQLYERIRQLEKDGGNDGCYFYCSDNCKNLCPLYNLKKDPFKDNVEKKYTQQEYQQFREFVLERDEYKCQYCGEKAEHVHHERPQKLEPFFSLDPDLAWSVCSECHYKYGHNDECNTGNLSTIICK